MLPLNIEGYCKECPKKAGLHFSKPPCEKLMDVIHLWVNITTKDMPKLFYLESRRHKQRWLLLFKKWSLVIP